jgi:hypothetical protein
VPAAGAAAGGAVSAGAQYQCGLTLISCPHAPHGDPYALLM